MSEARRETEPLNPDERELAEEAWAGDILGIPNHGNLRIGDALTEGEELRFTGIPSFAPELLKRVRAEDPMRSKHLGRALLQLAEEGAAQVFRPTFGNEWIVGVAGALQFDVLADRIRTEYNIPVHFEGTTLFTARWIDTEDHQRLKRRRHCEPVRWHVVFDGKRRGGDHRCRDTTTIVAGKPHNGRVSVTLRHPARSCRR